MENTDMRADREQARELLSPDRCGHIGESNMATSMVRSLENGPSSTLGESAVPMRAALVRPVSVRTPMFDVQKSGRIYLFIYRVRHGYDAYAWVDNIRYCTVFALGKDFAAAEQIAINCVHQHGWRILKTDTATVFDADRFVDSGSDTAHLANLRDFGVSFKLNH
jgi:hypothetical protein